jgi:hypothetical protein
MLKFLRRDPAAYTALLDALLVLAISWGWFGLTPDKLPLIMAVATTATGVITAIYTKRTGFSFAIGFVKATVALLVGYGVNITDDKQTAIIGATVVVLGFFNWQANSPADEPGLHEEPMPTGPVVNQTIVSSALPDVDVPSPFSPGAA